ncbi:MAG: hypothetical protein CMN00_00800 [Rickettsiales bacterium]|nr:hypothetical protein [Rickettsiales bacterium]
MINKFILFFLLFFVFSSVEADEKKEVYKYLNLFGEAFEKIKNNYVEEITVKEIAIKVIESFLRINFIIIPPI